MDAMSRAIHSGEDFTPSDFGEVIAEGVGSPTEEVKRELSKKYPMFDKPKDVNLEPRK